MRTLSCDLETYSAVPIAKAGAYRYAADPSFEILLFAYSVDNSVIKVVDLAQGEELPAEIREALTDPAVTKWAHNAAFERICLSRWLGVDLDPAQWRCTMVWASTVGLPMSLEGVGKALHLGQQKLSEGKSLIRYFCQPCAPTKANGGRTRNLPEHDPGKWERFALYCARDVEVEQQIREALSGFPMPAQEWNLWAIDQHINDRGVGVDLQLAEQAVACDQQHRSAAMRRARQLTGLDNPNSVSQLLGWLASRGLELPDLTKASVSDALAGELDDSVAEALHLRQELSRSSVRKYEAVLACAAPEGRARGLLQFVGAGRTGRWAGRLIQVQNLPQNKMGDLDEARALIRGGHFDAVDLLYPSVPDTLSQLIRTTFVPKAGHRFLVADFSAIEARVLAWLAGEKWALDAFAAGEDLYCTTASRMFGVPVVKHGANSELRQKGKVAVLACGYGGSTGALTAMGALRMGLAEDELKPIVDAWRAANPRITEYWWAIDRAAKHTITTGETVHLTHELATSLRRGVLLITLPSGRHLAYPRARVVPGKFERPAIDYMGLDTASRWTRIPSYGPKLVENIVQAISRDLLGNALRRLHDSGFATVIHVHDEVVVEEPLDGRGIDDVIGRMTLLPDWAQGLPLDADGYACDFYRKD
ncbi:MAG: DNA polymerase [Propionibacteriaceae bacterium]|nr:DNA polymerase [Propionibacteriaceae bacterium]